MTDIEQIREFIKGWQDFHIRGMKKGAAAYHQGAVAVCTEILTGIDNLLAESEDERIRKEIIDFLVKERKGRWAQWLEKQKEQKPKAKAKSPLSPHELYDAKIEGISQGRQDVIDHPEQFGLQKPAEWSEEDEKMLADTLKSLRRYQLSMPNYQVELQIRWLKSLRPSWKPSEEQIRLLQYLSKGIDVASHERHILDDMIDDLKKLM
jgi:hypothetical protein